MPRKEEDNVTDPIILAAMVEDPDETEEEKQQREELLALTGNEAPSKVGSSQEEDESEEDEEDSEAEDEEEDTPESKPEKKPVEAEDDTEEDVDEELEDEETEEESGEEGKKTRKERRQERQEDFLESIRKDNAKERKRQQIPDYKPLDYRNEDAEFKPEELEEDRQRVGAVQFAKGAQTAQQWAEQELFWKELENEAKITKYDPELNFLHEETPDGKKNEKFDPEKAEEINGMYLQLVGFKQYPKRDDNGRILVDNNGQPIVSHSTVDRTDISYEKFAKNYVKKMKSWAEDFADDRVEEAKKNVTKQRRKQSVRPTSGKRKSLGSLNPGDISRMSDEELEKNEDEIDRQIDQMLGI